jgi:hypothetical protein
MSVMLNTSSIKRFNTLQRRRSSEPFLFPVKEVSFASVQVREYPMILGDNPSCTSGPPVTLDWTYDAKASMSCTVDEWESGRDSTRRMKSVIRVPSSVRTEWVLDAGFTPTEVHEAIRDVQNYQRRRRSSIEKSSLQEKACDVMESVKRRLERAHGSKLVRTQTHTNLGDFLTPVQVEE